MKFWPCYAFLTSLFLFFSGMDCKPSKNANKKLIQARLPFKRLNPEPKENHLPKRPCPHVYPESSDREIENESSPLPEQSRPPLVNGRGPLDGFLSRRHPAASDETMVIDLTEENTSKCLVSPAAPSPCLPTKDEHQGKDKTASSEKPSNLDNAHKHTLDSTAVKQEDRLRLRQEKERQREEAKAAKEKKKEEARKQKEEREREKREKKEKDEQEKREKKEKEEKEKAERLKKLAAACGKFAPFEIKENMSLAPLCRVQCEDSVLEELDRCLLNPSNNRNGLKDWIGQKPRQSGPTKPRQRASLSECVTVEGPKADGVPDRTRYGPMKLLQFHKNYRPAYWGTWSKKSSYVSPRCPLRRDKDLLDYEVDSDEEWEEEEPGESLSHSEGEDEEEGGEDDDDDDGFFVPHGYLSNDEGALEEEGGDLEKQKLRQTLKAREWDELMSTKKKMKVLEPVVRGCIWEGEGPGSEHLQPYAVCLVEPLPKADSSLSPEQLQLLPLLHGNANSSKVIISEYQEFCRRQTSSSSSSSSPPELSSPQNPAENIPTRIQLRRLIKNNAVYEKRSTYRRCCWYVHTDVLSRLGKEALPVPCQWTYLTTGAREESREETSSTTSSSSNKRKSTGSMSITKFMKRCTDPGQTEATEADGFQADNEDEDEEDCVLISTQSGELHQIG
uniref:Chromatin assembly factor 1, subunit A (p150) n=1 Tax=Scophthalmus maximus TaxID=52904 RepID=A0A8D3BMT2_SCOMX